MKPLVCALAAASLWAQIPVRQSRFAAAANEAPQGWKRWSPRSEIAPRTWVDANGGRRGGGALAASGNSDPAAYGGWEYLATGVEPGKWYRFTAWYRSAGLTFERGQVVTRLEWTAAGGRRAGQPDFPYLSSRQGE